MTPDDERSGGASTAAEIASQPEIWRRALALPPDQTAVLPTRDETVLALGCGT